MSEPLDPDCEHFDAHAEEVAIGHLEGPLRSELLAHVARCPTCHSLLDGLVTTADRLLLAAPEVEPPPGFEARVLARLDDDAADRPHARRRWPLISAAAAVMLVAGSLVAGALIADRSSSDDADDREATAAPIVTTSGDEIGSISLVYEPFAHVLITIDERGGGPGVRSCELQTPDGEWHRVGSWEASDVYTGVWATGIDDDLLDATAMHITAEGEIVATARFD